MAEQIPRRDFEAEPSRHGLEWQTSIADGRRLKVKPDTVWAFKARHKLPTDQPLSPEAAAQLLLEMENTSRARKGGQIAAERNLQAIRNRLTPELVGAIADACPLQSFLVGITGSWRWEEAVKRYLLDHLPALGLKRYERPAAAFKRLAEVFPVAAAEAEDLPRDQALVFWGIVTRLDQLEGFPPSDPVAFFKWSQLDVIVEAVPDRLGMLADLLAGRDAPSDEADRRRLGLPVSGPLAAAAIRAAFRDEARQHHPDAGGSDHLFRSLTEARDRLLMKAQPAVA